MKKLSLAAVIGFSTSMLVSGLALAGDAKMSQFDALDQNKDGQLSAEEVSVNEELSGKWSTIDADENGTIDRIEFSAFEPVPEQATEKAPTEEGSAN
ncbi:hypothetical protein GCM10011352_03600 [Marinobacterium zhoushanense]|uniref:EF-hand domain-containing protein n=1 Tax=Marinobacterium zhoushanense TaxID=1679163 RepID=A0ABQ1K0L2_9GAMM|nr:hypothetical protein [Marinobacterium zhoushanense]GGB81160.1 hypothetical protein GCM10011352_03600 [Marinobacterium zhoushanense]